MNPKGSALVFSLIVLSFLLISALSIAAVSLTDKKSSLSTKSSNISFQVADSASEALLQKIYKVNDKGGSYKIATPAGLGGGCAGTQVSGSAGVGTYFAILYGSDGLVPPTFTAIACSDTDWRAKVVKIKFQGIYQGTTRLIETGVKPPADTVAYWMLNDGAGIIAVDSSANGNNGTLKNGPTWVLDQGVYVLSFNGSNQYVDTPLEKLGYSAGTVTWWQKPSTAHNSGTARGIWGQTTGAGVPEFSAQVASDNKWYVGWNRLADDDRVSVAANASNYRKDQWDHYAFTWVEGGDSTFYQNGTVLGTKSGGTTVSDLVGHAWRIGIQGETSNYFPGIINGVHIYNRVLTVTEINNLP